MIDLKRLRQDPDAGRAGLARRRDPSLPAQVDLVLELDRRHRERLARFEECRAERKAASEEVARRKKNKAPADDLLARLKASGEDEKALEAQAREAETRLMHQLSLLPNFLLDQVPEGDATANRIVRSWGTAGSFDFTPKPHWDLGEALRILDLPAGARIAGSGFPLFRGMGARLVRALANFMLDLHVREHGYLEVAPPYLVNYDSIFGTGQMPKFADEL